MLGTFAAQCWDISSTLLGTLAPLIPEWDHSAVPCLRRDRETERGDAVSDVFSAPCCCTGCRDPSAKTDRHRRAAGVRLRRAGEELRIALEIEGGTWTGGRHVRGRGYQADCEKYSEAALQGWRVLRATPAMLQDGRALAMLELRFRAVAIISAADLDQRQPR